MGIGDWGLGMGVWGLGIGPNPQSPIPNPQSPNIYFNNNIFLKINFKILNKRFIIKLYQNIIKINNLFKNVRKEN